MTSGIEHGILKHWSCSSNFLGKTSLPSGSTTQSSNSASAVYKAEHTGTSWTKSSNNLDRTSGGTGAENSHSVSALFTSEFASVETQLNAKKISMQKGTVAKRSHSTSVVSGSELTSVNLTTRTSLGSASTPSGTGAESIYWAYFTSLFYFSLLVYLLYFFVSFSKYTCRFTSLHSDVVERSVSLYLIITIFIFCIHAVVYLYVLLLPLLKIKLLPHTKKTNVWQWAL